MGDNDNLQKKMNSVIISTSGYKDNIDFSSEFYSLKKSLLIFSDYINSYCKELGSAMSNMTRSISEMCTILAEVQQLQFNAFNDRLKDILNNFRIMSDLPADFKFQVPNFESLEKLEQIDVEVDVDEIESVIGKEAVQSITYNVTNNFYFNEQGQKKVKLSAESVIKLIITLWAIINFILSKCEENMNIQQEQNAPQQTEYHEVFKLYNSIVKQLPDYYELED